MLALWDKLDKDIIKLLSDSNVDAIGDLISKVIWQKRNS
jgi:hypothetical protein